MRDKVTQQKGMLASYVCCIDFLQRTQDSLLRRWKQLLNLQNKAWKTTRITQTLIGLSLCKRQWLV